MKPILFSTPMVQAILAGRKAQTRRVIKNKPCECESKTVNGICKITDDKGGFYLPEDYIKARSPYQPGDILWVRETWQEIVNPENLDHIRWAYRATETEYGVNDGLKWRPAIFMPREAARIFLRVTDVRVERVQDITEEEAKAEGAINQKIHEIYLGIHPRVIRSTVDCTYREGFQNLWDSINAKRGHGWEVNDWVWAYTFERISKEGVRE
jgi:hypothetical protein